MPEQEALHYFGQISTALDYMHSRKMLHLDLKPGNIMLRDEGEAVLIDFGLSKQYDENGEPESSTTIDGGTPGYAPTEQADYEEGKGDFPVTVECVSWNDVQEFLRKLNQMTGKRYRLPTEAEWEYAARGGNRSRGYKYSGSNNIGSVAWYDGNSGDKPHPVGQKSPNELGLYDMSGNVLECCSDWLSGSYYSSSPSTTPPQGPSMGSHRVIRGASWLHDADGCRVSYRYQTTPGDSSFALGFRLAL